MGCTGSKEAVGEPKKQAKSAGKPVTKCGNGTISDPFAEERAKRNRNPADYVFENHHNETLVKEEGSLKGDNFDIRDCTDCDIFILDHTSQILIDRLKRCRIYIGPCTSSIFMRNCKDCKFVMACGQMRTRDCKDIDMLLYCASRPTMERSSNFKLGCFNMGYISLRKQFESAELSVWKNPWTDLHDFSRDGSKKWTYLPFGSKASELLDFDKLCSTVTSITLEELETTASPVPITSGIAAPQPQSSGFLAAFGSENAQQVYEKLLLEYPDQALPVFVRSHEHNLTKAQCKSLFGKKMKFDDVTEVIGFEVSLEVPGVGDFMRKLADQNRDRYFAAINDKDAFRTLDLFFTHYMPVEGPSLGAGY